MFGKKTNTPVIELRGLTKQYGVGDAEMKALDGVDLVIEKGEFITIMGPSGCGKTTLLNILGLLDRANSGEYVLDGKSVERLSAARHARIRSEQIGIIFQHFNLIERLPVIENVALPLTYLGVRRLKRLKIASDILKRFHLQEREYYMPWQLSGGQMQRVAIARALVNKPSIVLADEPTGNLDSKSSHIIMQELSDLHKMGNTIIMVTHNPNLTTYASRVINMLDGKIDRDSKHDREEVEKNQARLPIGSEKVAMSTRNASTAGQKLVIEERKTLGTNRKKSSEAKQKKSSSTAKNPKTTKTDTKKKAAKKSSSTTTNKAKGAKK